MLICNFYPGGFVYVTGRSISIKHRCVTPLYHIPLGIFNYVLVKSIELNPNQP